MAKSARQKAVDRLHQNVLKFLKEGKVPLCKIDGSWCIDVGLNPYPVKLLSTRIVDTEGFFLQDGMIWPGRYQQEARAQDEDRT